MTMSTRSTRTIAQSAFIVCATSLGFIACSSGSTNKSAGTGGTSANGGASSGGSTSSDGGSGENAGSSNAGTSGIADCPAPPDLGVRFVGRVDGCDPLGVRMSWSGTGFVGKFKGTGIHVEVNEASNPNQYTVIVDGTLSPTLKTAKGQKTYSLISGLASAEHTIEFYRRTEASQGMTEIMDVEAEEGDAGVGELLTAPEASNRRIEVVGDSISCGYGNEGTNCTFSPDTENDYLAYGSILARSFGAELSTVAWSGKGVYSNYGGNRVEPLPALYDLTVPQDGKHPWPFAWQPDLVLINLGTNDYSGSTDPTDSQFESAYQSFLEHIRSKYPRAYILCTNGPMLAATDLAKLRQNAVAAIAARQAAGDTNVKWYDMKTPNADPVGCDYHPNLATHAAMAAEIATEISQDLGW